MRPALIGFISLIICHLTIHWDTSWLVPIDLGIWLSYSGSTRAGFRAPHHSLGFKMACSYRSRYLVELFWVHKCCLQSTSPFTGNEDCFNLSILVLGWAILGPQELTLEHLTIYWYPRWLAPIDLSTWLRYSGSTGAGIRAPPHSLRSKMAWSWDNYWYR